MNKKISWSSLYKQFKSKFPNLSKRAIYFKPLSFMTIEVWFEDGKVAAYDGLMNSLKFLDKTWLQKGE